MIMPWPRCQSTVSRFYVNWELHVERFASCLRTAAAFSFFHDGTLGYLIAPGNLVKIRRTELGCALLRLEVHVHQPEPITIPVGPLEVVHRAPLEVAFHRHAIIGRPEELRQVTTKEHDAVGVIDS